MKTKRVTRHLLRICGALAALGAIGLGFWRFGQGEEAKGALYREVRPKRGAISVAVLSPGVVQPQNRLEIKPPVSGRVEDVLVAEGQKVRKGQFLAWISSTERAALLDAARAKGAEELKRWEDFYKATPILAPIDGTIIVRSVEPGQTFTNQEAVLVMSDRLTVKAQVDETDIAEIYLEQPAEITLDAYPAKPFSGRVVQIAYDAVTVNNVTTYTVDVLPESAPDFMRSGMTANVTFAGAVHDDVLLVPSQAIKIGNGGFVVLTRGAGGPPATPQERSIRVGVNDGKQAEIIEGLSENDTVLIAGAKVLAAPQASNPFSPFGARRSR